MGLAKYRQKRDFNQTSEPSGDSKPKARQQLAFVVQKHQASHLHYDFRLELDGVLKSWAVPKGPSLNPEDKRLAMEVEDHPFDYRTFEGEIPAGNYGAGQVIVWDEGNYLPLDPLDDPAAQVRSGLAKGKLQFVLNGQKLKGQFTLIKTGNKGQNSWLLKKHPDEYADQKAELSNQSVRSKRRLPGDSQLDIQGETAPLPRRLKPMLATLTDQAFSDELWQFEIKWDGYRALGSWDGRQPDLYSRNGNDLVSHYPPIAEALRQLPKAALLDGEIVCLDESGKSHFDWLQNYQQQPKGNLTYMVFDLLWLNGEDLTGLSLNQRRDKLKQLMSDVKAPIQLSDEVVGKGEGLYRQAVKLGLEGIVAKKLSSHYESGRRSKQWLKIKTVNRQEFVIAGYTYQKDHPKTVGALLLGVNEAGSLRYVGKVGTGLPKDILSKLRPLETNNCPFESAPKEKSVHWLKPQLLAEVRFSEWTAADHLRHPSFIALRDDKAPAEVKRERPQPAAKQSDSTNEAIRPVKFSHLDKVFWPERGYTKGDLIDYYRGMAPIMLPYVINRPCNLKRLPSGIEGKSFYQKDMASASLPEWVKTIKVFSESNKKDISYYVIDSKEALLELIQLGCVEIHPWNSTIDHLESPDWAVIDLDPQGVNFEQVVEVALVVKDICDQLSIACYPKTSGQRGIHVYIPLGHRYRYDQVRQFAELLSQLVMQRTTPITSMVRSPAKRQHQIYLDYLQNRESQTIVAPYSVRPTVDASVSTPLKWSEVNKDLRPEKFTIKSLPSRLEQLGDLWKPVLEDQVDILEVLKKLE